MSRRASRQHAAASVPTSPARLPPPISVPSDHVDIHVSHAVPNLTRCPIRVDDMMWSPEPDGTVSVRETHRCQTVTVIPRKERAVVTCLLVVDGSSVWAGLSDGFIRIFTLGGEMTREFVQHDGPIYCMTAGGGRVFTGGADWKIFEWHGENAEYVRQFYGHMNSVRALSFFERPPASGASYLLSTSDDASVRVWNPHAPAQHTKDVACIHTMKGHNKGVLAVDTFAERNQMWTGGDDHSLIVTDLNTFQTLAVLQAHSGPVTTIRTIGCRVLTGAKDGVVIAWDPTTFRQVATHHHTLRFTEKYVTGIMVAKRARAMQVWCATSDGRGASLLIEDDSEEPEDMALRRALVTQQQEVYELRAEKRLDESRIAELNAAVAELEAQNDPERLRAAEAETEEVRQSLLAVREKASLADELLGVARGKMDAAEVELADEREEHDQCKDLVNQLNRDNEAANAQISRLETALTDAESREQVLHERIATLEAELRGASVREQQEQKAVFEARAANEQQQADADREHEKDLARVADERRGLEAAIANEKAQREHISDTLANTSAKLSKLAGENELLRDRIDELTVVNSDLSARVDSLSSHVKETEARSGAAEETSRDLQAEHHVVKGQLEESKQREAALRDDMARLTARHAEVQALLAEKSQQQQSTPASPTAPAPSASAATDEKHLQTDARTTGSVGLQTDPELATTHERRVHDEGESPRRVVARAAVDEENSRALLHELTVNAAQLERELRYWKRHFDEEPEALTRSPTAAPELELPADTASTPGSPGVSAPLCDDDITCNIDDDITAAAHSCDTLRSQIAYYRKLAQVSELSPPGTPPLSARSDGTPSLRGADAEMEEVARAPVATEEDRDGDGDAIVAARNAPAETTEERSIGAPGSPSPAVADSQDIVAPVALRPVVELTTSATQTDPVTIEADVKRDETAAHDDITTRARSSEPEPVPAPRSTSPTAPPEAASSHDREVEDVNDETPERIERTTRDCDLDDSAPVATLSADSGEASARVQALTKENEELRAAIDASEAETRAARSDLSCEQVERADAQRVAAEVDDRARRAEEALTQAEHDADSANDALAAAESRIASLEEHEQRLLAQLATATDSANAATEEVALKQREVAELRTSTSTTADDVATLRRENERLRQLATERAQHATRLRQQLHESRRSGGGTGPAETKNQAGPSPPAATSDTPVTQQHQQQMKRDLEWSNTRIAELEAEVNACRSRPDHTWGERADAAAALAGAVADTQRQSARASSAEAAVEELQLEHSESEERWSILFNWAVSTLELCAQHVGKTRQDAVPAAATTTTTSSVSRVEIEALRGEYARIADAIERHGLPAIEPTPTASPVTDTDVRDQLTAMNLEVLRALRRALELTEASTDGLSKGLENSQEGDSTAIVRLRSEIAKRDRVISNLLDGGVENDGEWNTAMEKCISELRRQCAALESDLGESRTQVSRADTECHVLAEKLEVTVTAREAAERQVARLTAELQALQDQFPLAEPADVEGDAMRDAEARIEELEKAAADLEAKAEQAEALQREVDEAKAALASSDERTAAAQEAESALAVALDEVKSQLREVTSQREVVNLRLMAAQSRLQALETASTGDAGPTAQETTADVGTDTEGLSDAKNPDATASDASPTRAETSASADADRQEHDKELDLLRRQLVLKEQLVRHLQHEVQALNEINNATSAASPRASTQGAVAERLLGDEAEQAEAWDRLQAMADAVGVPLLAGGLLQFVEDLTAALRLAKTSAADAQEELNSKQKTLAAQQKRLVRLADANKAMADDLEHAKQRHRVEEEGASVGRETLVKLIWAAYVHADSGMRALSRHLTEVRKLKVRHDYLYREMVPDLNVVVKGLGEASQTAYAMVRQCLTEDERQRLRDTVGFDAVGESVSPSPEPVVP